MADHLKQTIEFFGGPLDGAVEALYKPLEPLVAFRNPSVPRRDGWIFRLLRRVGGRRSKNGASTSSDVPFAIYSLQSHHTGLVYRYLCSTVGTDQSLQQSHVQLMAFDENRSLTAQQQLQ